MLLGSLILALRELLQSETRIDLFTYAWLILWWVIIKCLVDDKARMKKTNSLAWENCICYETYLTRNTFMYSNYCRREYKNYSLPRKWRFTLYLRFGKLVYSCVIIRAPQYVEVLAADVLFCSRLSWLVSKLLVYKVGVSGRKQLVETTRNLEIQDGEDVDVLRRPGHNLDKKIRIVVLRPFKFVVN